MKWLTAVLVVYGLANIGLGVEAFVMKGSLISLAAAGGAGFLVLVTAWIAQGNPKVGYGAAGLVALLLVGRFLPKLIKEGQVFPAGVVVAMSVVVLACLAVGHVLSRRILNSGRVQGN